MKEALLFFLIFSKVIYAQPLVIYSTPFEEPKNLMKELLILKNGNTGFINIADDNMEVVIYDSSYQIRVKGSTDNDIWTDRKVSAAILKGIHEIDGQIVLFLSQLNRGNMLTFHRVVISGETGKIVKADKLAEMPTRRAAGYNLRYSHELLISSDYYISFDPVTEKYAVLLFEGYSADKPDRVKMQLYDNKHALTKEVVLNSTVTSTKFTHYAGMCMYNGDVFVGTNDYDPKSKSNDVPLYLSILRDGASAFETRKIDIKPINNMSYSILVYNEGTNMLQLLTHTQVESEMKNRIGSNTTITNYYATILTLINPIDLQIVSSNLFNTPKADIYAKQKLGIRNGFNGVLPEMNLSHNYETVLIVNEFSSRESMGTGGTYQENIGVVYVDNAGKEKESYVVRAPERLSSLISEKTSGSTVSLPFVSTKSGDYLIINDLPENFDKSQKERQHHVNSISDQNAIIYKLKNGDVKKSYLFGAPESKFHSKFIMGPAAFDKTRNVLATMMIENNKGKKQARIAWIDLRSAK